MRNLLLPLSLLLMSACGATQLDRQVTAANFTRVGLDLAADSLELVCDPVRVEAADAPAERASRCLKAFEGHDSSRAAWNVWAQGLVAAGNDEDALRIAWGLAGPVLVLYGELSEFLAEFDLALPALNFGGE